jgi:hypothetical protein
MKEIVKIINECQLELNKYILENGMSIIDLRFQITLERLKYEFCNYTKPRKSTIQAMHQMCVFTTGFYKSKIPIFEKMTSDLFFLLNDFSDDLKKYKIIPIGTEHKNWKQFYELLDDE